MATTRTVSLVVEYKNGKLTTSEMNKTADAVEKTGKNVDKTTASFGKMKLQAAAFGVAMAAAFKLGYDAFTKQQDAVVRMEASLRALGQYTPTLSKTFRDLATELQRTSRYGDEELLPMFSKLISLGGVTEKQMGRVMRAAMDFAVVTGSLDTAVDLLAKAAVGYTSSLSRYGIILDEAIPQNEKFEAVLNLIETRMSGMERQMSKTTSGGVKQMFNAIGDLLELGFRPFAPFVDLTSTAVTNLAYALGNAAEEAGRLKDNLPQETAAFGGAGIFALYAQRQMTPEELRNRPPLVGGSPITGAGGSGLSLQMTDATQARIRANQINRVGAGNLSRPDVNGITMPNAEAGLTAPSMDMSNPPGAGSGDQYSNRLSYFEADLQKMFNTADEGMSHTAGMAQNAAGIIGGAFANAFGQMASGAMGAGDAIMGALLGALGTIATMWGSFLVSVGLGMQFVPGMQAGAGAVAYGAALLALGGTLQGLAGSIGGGGGGSAIGGGGGGGTPYYGAGASMGAGTPNVYIVAVNGSATKGTDLTRGLRSAGVEGAQLRELVGLIKHQNSTGTNVADLK